MSRNGRSEATGRLVAVRPEGTAIHGGGQWELLGPDPARIGEVVPADVNDPWYPPAPAVQKAVAAAVQHLQHTPEVHAEGLRLALAEQLAIAPETLLLGAGSSPVLHHLIERTCGPGRPVLVPAPTYSEYERVAQLAGAPIYRWLLDPRTGFAIDPAELATAAGRCGARLVVLANPGNPSGHTLEAAAMLDLAARLPPDCRLLVDEAYIDQQPRATVLGRLADAPRMAVVRSLSKGAALSGLRFGFGVAGEEWAQALPWETPPWPINLLAQAAVLPAWRERPYIAKRVEETRALRRALACRLAALPGLRPLATSTHYFLLHLAPPWPPSTVLVQRLRRRGVLVRDCAPYGPPLDDRHLRITTRSAEENDRLARAFEEEAQKP